MKKHSYIKSIALGGASAAVLATGAYADQFNIPSGDLKAALHAYSTQTGVPLIASDEAVKDARTRGASGELTADVALSHILAGTGFVARREANAIAIVHGVRSSASDLSVTSPMKVAAAAGPSGGIESVLVTAQKRTEDIQMVPIAVTALSSQQLNAMKIEGGPDLLKTIPNVTFSKNNFTGYNFSIRGVGTKAISATTDPGVAVAFNSTTLIQNRLFEQEYFDVERVEILRGPQGTLYGRNATSGVINVISNKADLGEFSGSIKGEVGNYQSRRGVGMLNIPIITDKLALRVAGSYTKREGYDFNTGTNHRVNGRDLWSTRATLGFKPIEQLRGNLIWEHFDENDNRSRTGKQLCHRDNGPTEVGGIQLNTINDGKYQAMLPSLFSAGCKAGSLYDDAAFGTPNGLALPFVWAMIALGAPCFNLPPGSTCIYYPLGYTDPNDYLSGKTLLKLADPYGGKTQSKNLRVIDSFKDPVYRAKADVIELNFDYDITDALTFTSQTAYDKDRVYSFQDFNRFNTVPVFNDTSNLFLTNGDPSPYRSMAPGGMFCDPQLGCSNSIAGFDISQGKASQFNQEFRLQSNLSGPLNFSMGANYTRFNTLIDYYVFYNLITAFAEMFPYNSQPDITKCGYTANFNNANPLLDINSPDAGCPYIDPNPIDKINGEGHNYFRSENPYKLRSTAAFGEVYWQVADDVKLTAGLRYTDDRKIFTPIPTQILLDKVFIGGGTVNRGYPANPDIKQHWGKFTGRLNASWMPKIDFTDQSMFYASYSRGYKGGGANPPTPGFDPRTLAERFGLPPGLDPIYYRPIMYLFGVEYGPTFRPEFVNAYEVGSKNTLLDGRMVVNGDVFFYDYKDYQVSQIRDRTAVNENFNAKIWGAELETLWQPVPDLRLNANLGYLDTSIGKGMQSIDTMNRTQGNSDFIVVKPFLTLPSNCIVPVEVVKAFLEAGGGRWYQLCGGGGFPPQPPPIDPATGQTYDPATYPIHGGAGFAADLSGNQLPNSPHFTFNIGAQYSLHWIKGWDTRVRSDFYHQASSFARVYNDRPYDRLRGWNNANLSLTFERVDDALSIELYCKNIFNATPITDAFLNSDDTALTTNVFTLDPRLIGFSITKPF